jgi:hypothetical protein
LRARTSFRRYRVRRVSFSSYARPDSFSAVPRASAPVFMFCGPVFGFDGTECVGSHFHVLRYQTRFLRYRGRRPPFSCFACPDTFSEVMRASGSIFMFCMPKLIFGGTEGVGSRFQDFSSDSFSKVPSASGTVFMFCASRLIFGCTEGVRSRFHVLRAWSHFRRYRGRLVQFSSFAFPDSFSAVPRASVPVFIFCAPGLVFGGTEGVVPRCQVLRAQTHFRR